LMQLRFASFAVINLREDLHLRESARAGRTKKNPASWAGLGSLFAVTHKAPAQGGKAGSRLAAARRNGTPIKSDIQL
ncbi:hypothetical protein, partial [Hydrogenophaga sp.]|uniref:hypothetical protein n=1 Tax=Hydrogenophaga sp. TaxID=1904254 RepID=UPI003AF4B11F